MAYGQPLRPILDQLCSWHSAAPLLRQVKATQLVGDYLQEPVKGNWSRKVHNSDTPSPTPLDKPKTYFLPGQEVGSGGANAEPTFLNPSRTRLTSHYTSLWSASGALIKHYYCFAFHLTAAGFLVGSPDVGEVVDLLYRNL
jgi:hypothetical protein